MIRVRWMRAKCPSTIRQLAKQLQNSKFTTESDEGFVIERVRDEFLEARYIERISFQQSISDPFGNTFVIDRLEFRQVDFTLTKAFPELELRMPPRGLKGFTGALLKASGFTMELEQHAVRLSKWIAALERQLGAKLIPRAAVASEIELEDGASARLAISGHRDIRPSLASLLPNRAYELETMQLDCRFDQSIEKLTLSSDCTARYSPSAPEELITAIRVALQSTSRPART